MTHPNATEELLARLAAGCDREALLALGDRREDPLARDALRLHLARCPACRAENLWLEELERLLGPVHEEHPASAALTAFAAGELGAEERGRIALHLESCVRCEDLRRGAVAGLEEARRVLAGLAAADALATRSPAHEEAELHLPLELPQPPALRAFAAEAAIERAAPIPEDRRVLLEEERIRVVYFRLGAEAVVALFAESLDAIAIEVSLDGRLLAPARPEAGVIRFALGAASELAGRELSLELRYGDHRVRRSFTLVESGA